jgi:hypothetical protein
VTAPSVSGSRGNPLRLGAVRLAPSSYGPQEAGRSAGFPVHWPLWPAPFPPFVGGAGFPKAVPIVSANANPANMLAKTLRREIFIRFPPFHRRFRRAG